MHCGYNARTNKVLHLNYKGTSQRHAQDHNRPMSSMAVVKCLQSRSCALKGGMVGKNKFVGQRQTFSLSWKVFSQRNISETLLGTTRSRSPAWVIEQRGVFICRNAPCLKLSVRQRKRSFSLGGVCDPVFYFPNRGFPNE